MSFVEHRTRLIALLEEKAWPVNENDVLLLEREISRGEAYIRQAEDLMKLPTKNDDKVLCRC